MKSDRRFGFRDPKLVENEWSLGGFKGKNNKVAITATLPAP